MTRLFCVMCKKVLEPGNRFAPYAHNQGECLECLLKREGDPNGFYFAVVGSDGIARWTDFGRPNGVYAGTKVI